VKEERFILFLRKLPAVSRDDGVIHDYIIALPGGVAGQYIHIGNGIFAFRHADPRKIGERGHMVVIGHQAVADLSMGQRAGPGNDKGNADAPFMAGPFQAGQIGHGVVWPNAAAAAAENEMIKSLRTELDRTKEAYEALLEAKSCDTREGNVTFSRAMQTLERLKDYLGPTALEEYQTLGGE